MIGRKDENGPQGNGINEDVAFTLNATDKHAVALETFHCTSSKPKSEKQIIKWLKGPYSDAAEYKMWGNGVALPCVYFVLSGIMWTKEK